MEKFIIAVIAGFVLLMGYVLYKDYTAEKISIVKANFTCTASHTEHSFIMVGKVFVPSNETICDNYKRTN
jgi:hypothetical protein